jgi:phosphatidate cytidylyltransferase
LSELLKRILVALVLIPIAILVIYKDGVAFSLALLGISAIALWEYYRISVAKGAKPNIAAGLIGGVILQVWFFMIFETGKIGLYSFITLIFISSLIIIVFSMELFLNIRNSVINTAVTIAGILYINLPLSFIYAIRKFNQIDWNSMLQTIDSTAYSTPYFDFFSIRDDGWAAGFLLSMFAAVWISDSAAYFIGVKFGKHKLYPRVSPKKSWEGAVACFLSAIIFFILVSYYLAPHIPLIHSIIIGTIIGITGQLGDLAESQLKRDAGIKDSSAIIPGHGGFLDRFDGIIFIAPAVFIYLFLIRIL